MNSNGTPLKILVADTQFLVTETLQSMLTQSDKYEWIGLAGDIREVRMLLREHHPDIIITDHNTIDYNGITTLAEMVVEHPDLSVIILARYLSRTELSGLHKAGIKVILLKTAGREEILKALDCAALRKKFYSEEVLDMLMTQDTDNSSASEQGSLTPSEIGIVKLIARGLTTKEIAAQKNISFHTVMSHRKNIFRKLNINNASELVMVAVRNGWTDPIEYYI